MKIYWNVPDRELLKSATGSAQLFQSLMWVLRDEVPVELYLVQPSSDLESLEAFSLEDGWAVKFAIKVQTNLSSAPLAAAATWTYVTDHYEATIDLKTAALIAAVGTATSLSTIAEWTLQDANGKNRFSTQIACTIKPDVWRPDVDSIPASLSPWWEFYTDEATGKKCLRITNPDGEVLATFTPAGV